MRYALLIAGLAICLTACGDQNSSANEVANEAVNDIANGDGPDVTLTETALDDTAADVALTDTAMDDTAADVMANATAALESETAEDAMDEDPAAAWQRDMVEYGNNAYATRDRAILKIDDAVYFEEGQTAYLVRHEDERVHFLWSLEEPDAPVLSITYTGDTAPMVVRGQTEADDLIRAAMADMDMELEGLGLEYDMLTYHDEHASYVVEDGIQVTAYEAQLAPGETGLRVTVYNENNPIAANFEGLRFYDYDPEYVIEAAFTPLDAFEPKVFQTSRGWFKQFYHVGHATFSVGGETVTMPMYGFVTDPGEVEDISAFFTDAEAGHETYGVGRYIDVEMEAGDFPPETITLDFNYAYNPNCARSDYYNCPYAEFDIPVAVRAGEMIPLEAH